MVVIPRPTLNAVKGRSRDQAGLVPLLKGADTA